MLAITEPSAWDLTRSPTMGRKRRTCVPLGLLSGVRSGFEPPVVIDSSCSFPGQFEIQIAIRPSSSTVAHGKGTTMRSSHAICAHALSLDQGFRDITSS
jgi:hypothetical protein